MTARELAVALAGQSPELRTDLVYAIDAALDLRGFDRAVDGDRCDRLQALRDVLTSEDAIAAGLDELLIRRVRGVGVRRRPSAAAVRMSIDAPTMWGEGDA